MPRIPARGWAALLSLLPGTVLVAGLAEGRQAAARTLQVGPGREFVSPSAAAAAASDGDVVLIAPGEYYDCAVWGRNHLTVAGSGPGVVITDTVCQGKALFVVTGDQVTVRDMTLARARTPDGNGAGIRAEGRTLAVERVTFRDDEVGLLSGVAGPGTISLVDCTFDGNTGGPGAVRPAVQVGGIALLQVTGSRFGGNAGGQVLSAASRTVLQGNSVTLGKRGGPAEAVIVDGALLAEDNGFRFAAGAGPTAAIRAMGEDAPILRRNRISGDDARLATLLVNWTGVEATLDGNELGGAQPVTTSGLWRHRASAGAHAAWDSLRAVAGGAKRALSGVIGR